MNIRTPVFDAIRALRASAPFSDMEVAQVDDLLDRLKIPRENMKLAELEEPSWIAQARSKIGQTEILGPKNNSWIATGWARLGAKWYNSDETPWCGFFIADCLNAVSLAYPKHFPAAASFKDFGTSCRAQLGAIGVKSRKGGNHVFFIVGETKDKRFFKALGGNQRNQVNIMDIRKSEVDSIRWPSGSSTPTTIILPVMEYGIVSENES
jgi:uncharacterized protein (TIGR02594 family)